MLTRRERAEASYRSPHSELSELKAVHGPYSFFVEAGKKGSEPASRLALLKGVKLVSYAVFWLCYSSFTIPRYIHPKRLSMYRNT